MMINMKKTLSILLLTITLVFCNSFGQVLASGVQMAMGSLSPSFYGPQSTTTWQGPGYWVYTSHSYVWDSGTTAGGTITLNAGNTGGYAINLLGSNDGMNWTALVSGNLGAPSYQTVFTGYTSGVFRYFKVTAQAYNGGPSISASATVQIIGVVADQNTAQSAADNSYWANQNAAAANSAAQAAQSAANSAASVSQTAATNASQAVNWLNGTWGGYSLGQVGSLANQANSNASSASTNAMNAYNQGVATNNSLNDSTNGLAAINTNVTNTNNNITNLQSKIPFLIPPSLTKVYGYNGATATSTTSMNVAMNYSGANEYQVQLDNGSWSAWTSLSSYNTSGYFTVSGITSSGQHTTKVNLRNNNGAGTVSPVTSGQMTFFKL